MKNTYYHIIRILLVHLEITLLIIQELKEHALRMQEIYMKLTKVVNCTQKQACVSNNFALKT